MNQKLRSEGIIMMACEFSSSCYSHLHIRNLERKCEGKKPITNIYQKTVWLKVEIMFSASVEFRYTAGERF